MKELQRCKPVYEELPGWSEDITNCKSLSDLPENARNYVRRVSELVGVRISTFSVGPGPHPNQRLRKRLVTNLNLSQYNHQSRYRAMRRYLLFLSKEENSLTVASHKKTLQTLRAKG